MPSSITVNRRLLESVRDEPKKMLLPISGYEKETVESLDDALEPIKDLFDQKLKQYITIAKMNSTDPEEGLSPDESACIHLYTIEWDVHDESLYMILNRTLRVADRNKLRPWFKYLKLFLTAFFKLPPSEHTLVWRGVRDDLSALYPKGKEFAWWALSSCTASISILETSNYLGKSGARTMFSIQTNSGKHIRAHSYFDNEDEILLPPAIYLKVIDILNPAEGLHIIHLREILPPYKMLAEPFDLSQMKQPLPEITPLLHPTKPPAEHENYLTTSVVSKPPEKQENLLTTNIASKPPVKQENSSTTSVAPKPPEKQENLLTTSIASKPPVKQENSSTTSVASKPPVKQENPLATSIASTPPVKQENYLTTSAVSKPPEKQETYPKPSATPKPSEKQETYTEPSVTPKPSVQSSGKKGELLYFIRGESF